MATLESLQAKIAQLQAQAEAIVKKDSGAVIEKIRGLVETHGLTVTDIEAHVGSGNKRGRKPAVKTTTRSSGSTPKYRDTKTGATWTGRGRAPAWIANAKDRTKFLVASSSPGKLPVYAPAVKAGNYVRGPQPALYRDPKSGATWSGRGKAPAWLAGAKDRSKFLIDGASAAANAKPAAKKAVAKKGATAKETAARKATSVKVPAKKAAAKNAVPAAFKKAPATNAPRKTASMPAPVAAVESGTALTS